MEEKKTSEEWQKLKPEIEVLDPDGWDRKNFHFSWYEELITEEEYNKRVIPSTVMVRDKNLLKQLSGLNKELI